MIQYSIARKEHLPGILALYRQLQPDEEALDIIEAEKIWEMSRHQGITYFIAADDGKVVSSLFLAIIPNMTRGGRSNGFIENVVTHEDFRGRGYAPALIGRASEIAENNHCYKIMLMTGSKQESTLRFYEKCGFNRNDKTAFIKWIK